MPWTDTDPMTERHKFLLAVEDGLFSMTELCERFGVSRKTGYKWVRRYREEGVDGLRDRSRAPVHCPHRTPEATCQLLIDARQTYPRWGPKKILAYLTPRHPTVVFPAASTVGDILKRAGLVPPRRLQRRPSHPGTNALTAEAPGEVWTADFKGEFRLRSGRYCYPLTVQDAYSRYLLVCTALPSTAHSKAEPVFNQLFRVHGLPRAIRTDNGVPFASRGLCGLSRLSIGWIKLKIGLQRIQPGCPQQNSRHERMHRTLKAETTRPPEASFPAQQQRFDAFRTEYNHIRPHQSLDGSPPASLYRRSKRPMPESGPVLTYPGHMEVRTVSTSGAIKFRNRPLFVSEVLAGERIALEEIEDRIWSVWLGHWLLARLDEQAWTLHSGHPSPSSS
jgi:transposase InsO family protein